ncbi:MAG: GlsB/YeaQ/YmgE family stress response membrane protein [Xanthomonadales bacterium]|nr:GlsB/YeaQ/YmgE family stress response membrane protein [Xanthomonadales bacterium]
MLRAWSILNGKRLSCRFHSKNKHSSPNPRGAHMEILYWIIIGGLAGWIAGMIMKGGGSGVVMNIVIGIVGAVIGGFVFGLLGIAAGGVIGSLVTAIIGAVLLLWIVGMVRKA